MAESDFSEKKPFDPFLGQKWNFQNKIFKIFEKIFFVFLLVFFLVFSFSFGFFSFFIFILFILFLFSKQLWGSIDFSSLFCMKSGDHKCIKQTEPDFSEKNPFGRFWAKRGKTGPKRAQNEVFGIFLKIASLLFSDFLHEVRGI